MLFTIRVNRIFTEEFENSEQNQAVNTTGDSIPCGWNTSKTGGGPLRNAVNEYGLYTVLVTCRKPEAKPFQRWVTHEVIPSVRKTGKYVHPDFEALTSGRMTEYNKALKEAKKTCGLLGLKGDYLVWKANELAYDMTGMDGLGILGVKEVYQPAAEKMECLASVGENILRILAEGTVEVPEKEGDIHYVAVKDVMDMEKVPKKVATAIEKNGIRLLENEKVFIHPNTVKMKLLKRSKMDTNQIGQALRAAPGAEPRRLRLGGMSVRGVILKRESINGY